MAQRDQLDLVGALRAHHDDDKLEDATESKVGKAQSPYAPQCRRIRRKVVAAPRLAKVPAQQRDRVFGQYGQLVFGERGVGRRALGLLTGMRADRDGTCRRSSPSRVRPTMVNCRGKEVAMPEFPGVTHVALTVTDLGRSRPWYQNLFGAEPVIDEDTGPFHHVVWVLGGQTLVAINKFPDPHGSEPFDERRPGLDHLAFACASRAELEQWESKLNDIGVDNGGIVDAPYGSGLSFRDPDNIALEFFAPPG
jgi:glyoxylase I family protein